MIKGYSKFLDFIEKIEKLVLAVAVPAMVVIMIYQVILRYIFKNSNSWSEEVTGHILILCVMLASAIAIRRNSHLQIDAILNLFSERGRAIMTVISNIIAIIFIVFLLMYSINLCMTGMSNVTAGLGIKMAIPYSAVPIGCVLMILTSIEVVLKNIVIIRNGSEAEEAAAEVSEEEAE